MMRGSVLALGVIGVMSMIGGVAADPIETRQAIMKSVGAAAKVSGEMAKGDIPFHPDIANSALATFAAAGKSFRSFFPEGTETGNDTAARATIWEDPDGFLAINDKFADAAVSAVAAEPADLEAFRAAFGSVAENCRACHEEYRVARN